MPVLSNIGNHSTEEDIDYEIIISASDIDLSTNCPDDALMFNVECDDNTLVLPLCDQIGEDSIECIFDVQDNQFGNTICEVIVSDSHGENDSEEFTFTVQSVNDEINVSLCPETSWEIQFDIDTEFTNMALLSYDVIHTDSDSCYGAYDIDSELQYEWIVSGIDSSPEPMIITGNTLEFYSPIDSEIFIDLNISIKSSSLFPCK